MRGGDGELEETESGRDKFNDGKKKKKIFIVALEKEKKNVLN